MTGAIIDLLRIHPDPGTTRLRAVRTSKKPESSDEEVLESDDKHNLLRIAVITRLVVEIGISQNKIPLTLALCQMFNDGKINVANVTSYSTVPKELETCFKMSHLLLKHRLATAQSVNIIPDLTVVNDEERLGLVACFTEKKGSELQQPAHAVLFSGSVTSKDAPEQVKAIKDVLKSYNVLDKLGHLVTDEGRDITGHRAGVFALLEQDTSLLERISCDLHVNNRAFTVACLKVFGKPKANVPSALQVLYLIFYCLSKPWRKWKGILAHYLTDQNNTKPPEPLITRWYTVILAANWAVLRRTALIKLASDVWYFFPASKQVIREMWRQLFTWLHDYSTQDEAPVWSWCITNDTEIDWEHESVRIKRKKRKLV